MRIILSLLTIFLSSGLVQAAKVDTIAVHSAAMNKAIKTVVIQPEGSKKKDLPTLYLLHGYSGNYGDWINKVPAIKELADHFGILIVCPDGGFGSWYWDSEIDQDFKYETFVAKELVNYIDGKYPVIKDRSKRGITGLSMGGHGALYLAIRHQDTFGAVGSTAGGVDIRPFPNNWDMAKRIGSYDQNPQVWEGHTVMELTHLIKPKSLEIFIDCGTEDFFYDVNAKFHEKLTYLNIPHRYLSMPGAHNWDYWSKSIQYQLIFFQDFFSKV